MSEQKTEDPQIQSQIKKYANQLETLVQSN